MKRLWTITAFFLFAASILFTFGNADDIARFYILYAMTALILSHVDKT